MPDDSDNLTFLDIEADIFQCPKRLSIQLKRNTYIIRFDNCSVRYRRFSFFQLQIAFLPWYLWRDRFFVCFNDFFRITTITHDTAIQPKETVTVLLRIFQAMCHDDD